jgi:periplasmic copper chaperone A
VMLMELKRPLNAGETVDVSLVVKGKDGKDETVALKVPVRALGGSQAKSDEHKGHKH